LYYRSRPVRKGGCTITVKGYAVFADEIGMYVLCTVEAVSWFNNEVNFVRARLLVEEAPRQTLLEIMVNETTKDLTYSDDWSDHTCPTTMRL
jgi:hypothetical protein